jgi:hypothetical protein
MAKSSQNAILCPSGDQTAVGARSPGWGERGRHGMLRASVRVHDDDRDLPRRTGTISSAKERGILINQSTAGAILAVHPGQSRR